VLLPLTGGVVIALGSHQTGLEIAAVIGLSIVIIIVLLICLLDLRMEYEHPKTATWSNMGFKQCKFLCWERFTWAVLVTWGIILMLGGFLIVNGGIAMYVRHGTYIRDELWSFLVEVTLMSVMTAIPIVLVSWNRGGHALDLALEVGVISGKFGGLHILLELAGFYSHAFSDDGEPLQRLSITGPGLYNMDNKTLEEKLYQQIIIRRQAGPGYETIFLRMLVAVFVISFILVGVVVLKGKCQALFGKAPVVQPGTVLTEKQEQKLKAKADLGIRMNVMLVLSVILGGLMMLVLLLGLRPEPYDPKYDAAIAAQVDQVSSLWATIATDGILAALGVCVFFVCLVAVNTRFAGFINAAPWSFMAELCIVVMLSVTPLGYVSYDRGHEHTDIAIQLGLLTLKFGGLHLLLELSGFYATAMGGRYRKDIIMKLRRVGDPPPRRSTIVELSPVQPEKNDQDISHKA